MTKSNDLKESRKNMKVSKSTEVSNEPLLIISRAIDRSHLAFKGYFKGSEIDSIFCKNHNLKIGGDFLVWARVRQLKNKTIHINIISSKEIT